MKVVPFRPRDLESIQRVAQGRAQSKGIDLHHALDMVAMECRFLGYEEAVNQLRARPDPTGRMHDAYLSGFWSGTWIGTGCSTLHLTLPVPLTELVTRDYLRGRSCGQRLRLAATDHLELRHDRQCDAYTTEILQFLAWGLELMAYSGLRAATSATHERLSWLKALPYQHEWALWECPESDGWLYIDSVERTLEGWAQLQAAEAWIIERDPGLYWFELDPEWEEGDHERIRFFLCSSPSMFQRAMEALDSIDASPEPLPIADSAYVDGFVSPAQRQARKFRRARRAASHAPPYSRPPVFGITPPRERFFGPDRDYGHDFGPEFESDEATA